MKIPLRKTYRMHRFMNAEHALPTRLAFAAIAYPGVAIATGSHTLAREMSHRFGRSDDFKTGLRRGAWYARRSWLNLDVSKDELFNFTEGLGQSELERLDRFIARRDGREGIPACIADRLYVAARQAVLGYGTPAWDRHIARYRGLADRLLGHVDLTQSGAVPDEAPRARRRGDFAVAKAREALRDFAGLFPAARWPWYVISGTLLGLVRENGFLPHDYDIDLGIDAGAADIDAIVSAVRSDRRFFLRKSDSHQVFRRQAGHTVASRAVPALVKLTHQGGVHIDLFVHHREGDVVWHGSSLHRWENSPFDLVERDLCGIPVLSPRDADRYLTENYGNWRVPVTEFNCSTDTANQAIVRHPLAVAIFLRRLVLEQALNPRVARGIAALLARDGYVEEVASGRLRLAEDAF